MPHSVAKTIETGQKKSKVLRRGRKTKCRQQKVRVRQESPSQRTPVSPSQRAHHQEHAVLRLSLGRENGWTNAISTVPANPRYHSINGLVPVAAGGPSNNSGPGQDAASAQPAAASAATNTTVRSRQTLTAPSPGSPRHSSSAVITLTTGPATPTSATSTKQLFLWVFKDPSHIHTLLMDRSNPSAQVRDYIERMFYVESDAYTLASLVPGVAYPIPIMKFASDLNKGFILCLPTKSFVVHVASTGGGEETFSVKVNPLQTVRDLKLQVQQLKGYPLHVQELLFDGHVLQNKQLVIDYKISNACRLQLYVQPCPSIALHVDTFWGKKYHIEISPCSTCDDLLSKVFRKTLARPAYREQILRTRTMYQGLVLVEHEGAILDRKYCLAYYGVAPEATLRVLSTSQTRRDQRTHVHVLQDTGSRLQLRCAPFDTWFVLALQLHGLTTLYLDMMKLLIADRTVEWQQAVGGPPSAQAGEEQKSLQVTLVMLPPPSGVLHKLTVYVRTAAGCVEAVSCGARETIKDMKRRLEQAGVDHAAYHDILYKKVRLPGNTKLYEYKLNAQEKCTMDMRLHEFPLSVQHGATTVKVAASHEHTVGALLRRLEDKLSVSPIKHSVLHAGEDLYSLDSALRLSDTLLHINTQLYIQTISSTHTLQLLPPGGGGGGAVPLPTKPSLDALYVQQLSAVCQEPEAFIEALKCFLKWRFPVKSNIFNPRRPADVYLPSRRPSSKTLNLGLGHLSSGRRTPGSASSSHNQLHERSACRSGNRARRQVPLMSKTPGTSGGGHHEALRNAVSDEEVYTQRQLATLPDIAHNNKTTDSAAAGGDVTGAVGWPKSAIKTCKSTDNLLYSDSRETFDSFASMPATLHGLHEASGAPGGGAKKKLSVRFDFPEGHEPPTREQRDRRSSAWHSSGGSNPSQRKAASTSTTTGAAASAATKMTPEDLIEYYQRLRVKRTAVRRSQSDRVAGAAPKSPKLTPTPVTNVTVKFSMNV